MMMILMLMKGEDSRNEIPKYNNDDVGEHTEPLPYILVT